MGDHEHKEANILSGVDTVKSLRDTGYKSTDYAIAELIDNAVDAKAANVTVAVVEEPHIGGQRRIQRASEILVLDDGCGMGEKLANLALSFGGSGDYDNRRTIGRFGMGLPQASVSQCRRTEVWSWQETQPGRAHRTCLDLDAIERGENPSLTVPWPTHPGGGEHAAPPDWALDLYGEFHRIHMNAGQPVTSGTIVRWTRLDRLRWVKAASVLHHTEFLLGRIYRRFIADGRLRIHLVIMERDENDQIKRSQIRLVRANDPLYLMTPKETILEYWEKGTPGSQEEIVRIEDEPPFIERDIPPEHPIPRIDGQGRSIVEVRYSEAPPEARPGINAGANTHLGKQAKENRGISIIRAGRELVLETSLVTEPVDRWWGVEIEFSPELDEVFGVTNKKQDAPYFTTALRYVLDNEMRKQDALDEGLFDDDDPVAYLYDLADIIRQRVNQIKSSQKQQISSRKNNTTPQNSSVTERLSEANRRRSEQHPTVGERERQYNDVSANRVAEDIERTLPSRSGLSPEEARVVANQYREGVNVHFLDTLQSQSPAFFWPDEVYDDQQIYVNRSHPAYDRLIRPLRLSSEEISGLEEEDAKKILGVASDCMALLLQAFARLELEVTGDHEAGHYYQYVREEWGRRLRELISDPTLAEIFDEYDDGRE